MPHKREHCSYLSKGMCKAGASCTCAYAKGLGVNVPLGDGEVMRPRATRREGHYIEEAEAYGQSTDAATLHGGTAGSREWQMEVTAGGEDAAESDEAGGDDANEPDETKGDVKDQAAPTPSGGDCL
jgi:hypothetical protein